MVLICWKLTVWERLKLVYIHTYIQTNETDQHTVEIVWRRFASNKEGYNSAVNVYVFLCVCECARHKTWHFPIESNDTVIQATTSFVYLNDSPVIRGDISRCYCVCASRRVWVCPSQNMTFSSMIQWHCHSSDHFVCIFECSKRMKSHSFRVTPANQLPVKHCLLFLVL